MLSNITPPIRPLLLNIARFGRNHEDMKHLIATTLVVCLSVMAVPASAEQCFADYKAKKDSPLRLHYGVVELYQGCSKKSARTEITGRISQDGWTLLNVLSIFDASGLAGKDSSAGQFYLRY